MKPCGVLEVNSFLLQASALVSATVVLCLCWYAVYSDDLLMTETDLLANIRRQIGCNSIQIWSIHLHGVFLILMQKAKGGVIHGNSLMQMK